MNEEIRVKVRSPRAATYRQMYYRDPITRKIAQTRSTEILNDGTKRTQREAERVAAKWEAELREGRYHQPSKITWEDFRDRYENEAAAAMKQTTANKVKGIFDSIEDIANPQRLADLDANRISHFQMKLREDKKSEHTIKAVLSHLKAALNWAKRKKMLREVPDIEMPKRAKGAKVMKGRPLRESEFKAMLKKVPQVLEPAPNEEGEQLVESWRYYLRGMWVSGLRLTESLEFWWDRPDRLCPMLDGERPMLWIPGGLQKSGVDTVMPMAPEFAEFLAQTQEEDRHGPVFDPRPKSGRGGRLSKDRVSRLAAAIGEAAGIEVHVYTSTGKKKYASLHDYRRSFGERWCTRVMPVVLKELMRHESIDTTLRYYVGQNAQRTADVLWEAHEKAKVAREPENTPNSEAMASGESFDPIW